MALWFKLLQTGLLWRVNFSSLENREGNQVGTRVPVLKPVL